MSSHNPLFYQSQLSLPTVRHGDGIWLYDEQDKGYLDGASGAVVASLGHGNARVLAAMHEQATKVAFAYRTQFESEPALALGRELVAKLSQGLDRVFYVSGGSEAVESAIKLARQYHLASGGHRRHKVVSRFPSYHGSTLGALNATGYAPLNDPFEPMLSGPIYVSAPGQYRTPPGLQEPVSAASFGTELEQVFLEHDPDTISAFILEPVGGASTGATVPPDGYLAEVTRVCRKYGVLIIYDEVMTGIGRTGAFCAYQHWEPGAEVDILALGKGMGAGYSPLGAVVCRGNVAEAVLAGGGFAHGHTYAGNPLSCAVGLAVLREIEERDLVANAARMGDLLLKRLGELRNSFALIGDVRGKGLLTAVEFVADRESKEPFPAEREVHSLISRLAFEEGLIVYPRRSRGGYSGDHVLIAPPLTITADELEQLLARFERSLKRASEFLRA